MNEIVEMGQDSAPEPAEISYPVGPSQLRRIVDLVAVPTAMGLASLVMAMASLMLIDPALEVGEVDLFTHGSPDANLLELRWASGLRALTALLALVLAIVAARQLLGGRAQVRLNADIPEADDPASLDAMEAEAINRLFVPSGPQATIVGAALLVSLLSLAFNVAAFWYAMANHIPQQGNPLGF